MRAPALIVLSTVATLALAACGGGEPAATTPEANYRGDEKLPNGMTIKEAIEARQHNLKDLGGAFKTINDQLKLPEPNMQEITFAAAEVKNHAADIDTWFHDGTGPDAGVKTEARADIWESRADFDQKAAAFETAAVALNEAVAGASKDAIAAATATTGGTCKACHDTYREKKD